MYNHVFFRIIHTRTIIYNKDWISYNPVRIIENGDLNHIVYNQDFFYIIYNLILDYIIRVRLSRKRGGGGNGAKDDNLL